MIRVFPLLLMLLFPLRWELNGLPVSKGKSRFSLFPEPSPNGRHVPKLTTAPNGTLVLTYAERRGQQAHYMVSVSENNGLSFSTPMPVDTAPFGAAILQRQPYVVMDASGTMHVLVEVEIGAGERGLAHKRSTDRGVT
ncbi:MAG: glycoside hydrolase, partial [Spirosomaceae bacterium]|nr:glycoside hydrolase [Spirosomataceae bacterium]